MDTLTWALSAFSAIAGSTTFITLFMYRKQTARTKNAEAFDKEVTALRVTVETLQKQVEWQAKQIIEVQSQVAAKDVHITQITREKHVLEIKHAKNKSAINCAYECTNRIAPDKCPVLLARAKNELDYVTEITKIENK